MSTRRLTHSRSPSSLPKPRSTQYRAQLTPELRAQFHRLLFTWSDKSRHRRIPWRELAQRTTANWTERDKVFIDFEDRFGEGNYAERKERLDQLLDELDETPNVDLKKLLDALWKAREQRVSAAQTGRAIDYRRMISEHRRLIKDFQNRLLKTRESYIDLLSYHGPAMSDAYDKLHDFEISLNLTHRLDLLRADLKHDPFLTVILSGPVRRAKRGRQSAPWLVRVRESLRRAGLEDSEDTLLMLVGLVPYPPTLTSARQ